MVWYIKLYAIRTSSSKGKIVFTWWITNQPQDQSQVAHLSKQGGVESWLIQISEVRHKGKRW